LKFFQLVPAGTKIDFIGKRKVAVAFSLALILAGVAAMVVRGPKLGIDFAGGTKIEFRFPPDSAADEGVIRELVTACGAESPSVVRYGESTAKDFVIQFKDASETMPSAEQCPLTPDQQASIERARSAAAGGESAGNERTDRIQYALANRIAQPEVLSVSFVGPRVGDELRRKGLNAIALACGLILVYIAFRFNPRYAPGAVVALIHDIAITSGFFVIFGWEFDLSVLAALLAILGYSLNDTIIVYDRIRELTERHTKHDFADVLNRAVNETLSRTILTSGTTLASAVVLAIMGGEVLRPFAIAMVIGVLVGTYSSIFIAAPMLLWLEQRRPAKAA
jgi:preprotein translocase subunit SecF